MKNTKNALKFTAKFTVISLIMAAAVILGGGAVGKSAVSDSVSDKNIVVVIDAGHGGQDGGAVADDGTLEKDLNLSLATSLGKILREMGADVVLTRDEDIMYADNDSSHKKLDDLTHRIKTAEDAGNCIFISIHMNKFPVPKYSGAQVYYPANVPGSEELAQSVQSAIKEYLQSENDRTIKKSGDNIYILTKLSCPAVLVECGFMSNPEELEKLKSEEYRNKIALIIAKAAIEYIYRE